MATSGDLNWPPVDTFSWPRTEGCDAIGRRDTDDLQSPRRLRQSQKRLTAEQTARMCQEYQNGATVNELGRGFGIDRRTVAIRMKKAGVIMRVRDVRSNSAVPS